MDTNSMKIPRAKSPLSWPLHGWPVRDRAAWEQAVRAGDPLEPGGIGAAWSPASRRKTALGYGRFIGWLASRGQLDPAAAPEDRVTLERIRAYLDNLKSSHGDYGLACRLQELGDALRAMAPRRDWRWILRTASRISSRARPAHDKLARMRSPDELVALGRRLMSSTGPTPLQTAVLYRDGLIIALLAHRPLRGRNLRAIEIERNLVRIGQSWVLVFTSSETKTGRPLELPFPLDLVPELERYLTVYRPVLLRAGSRLRVPPVASIWVSREGTAMAFSSIARRITDHTEKAFGQPVNPHMFRDCAATAIAVADPSNVRIITAVLGHATLTTSERHYNQARSLEASRLYNETLARLLARIDDPQLRTKPSRRRSPRCAR